MWVGSVGLYGVGVWVWVWVGSVGVWVGSVGLCGVGVWVGSVGLGGFVCGLGVWVFGLGVWVCVVWVFGLGVWVWVWVGYVGWECGFWVWVGFGAGLGVGLIVMHSFVVAENSCTIQKRLSSLLEITKSEGDDLAVYGC
ncbi:hypothetical protein RhiirC2_717434 [Rhizophagus irregularis]|uniref:Uncharacterized protein n=1 Tax=Rhizophagus irregularis TaxID=588596 RepID=A0A2N1MME5_9GLOM|nr:hypothetical protein RhiirC2_717434 [Rhizophagus irregularis]